MSGLGVYDALSGALQITVPSYSLRLVRRFGTPRVGWFLVTAFSLLALLHLLNPAWPGNAGSSGGISVELMFALGAGLLIIGLGHVEALLSERQRSQTEQQDLQARCRTEAEERVDDLIRANHFLYLRVTSLEEYERALKGSEAAYRLLFNEHPQAMWLFERSSFQLLAANTAALRQMGYGQAELLGLTALDLLEPDAVTPFKHDANRSFPEPQACGQWRHRRKDGSRIEIELTALDLQYADLPARLIVASVALPQQQLEKEFFRSQRQELARRVASDLGQNLDELLRTISSQANLLFRRSTYQSTTERLNRIAAAVNTASQLSRQMIMAGGQFSTRPELLELGSVLRRLRPAIQRAGGQRIVLKERIETALPSILADVQVVDHIIMTLSHNALESMPNGGTLSLEVSLVPPQAVKAPCSATARPRSYVRLTVRDTGCGIVPELQDHVFEPFFTTHGFGNGRSLGLASVYGAIQQLSGWIEFSSDSGRGTEFKLFFPEAPPPPAATESHFRRSVRY